MSSPDFLDSLDASRVHEQPEDEKAAPTASKPEPEDVDADEAENDEEQDEREEVQKPDPKAAKAEKEPATAAGSEDKASAGLKAGMMAERKKRQELEAKLRELEAKLKQPEQPAPQPVRFREDPEGFVTSAAAAVEARLYNAMEDDMREQHEDFDEMAALVVKAAEIDPLLKQKVFQAGNPARAMYKLGKQLQEAEKLRDPEAYKESIRSELEAEVTAKVTAQLRKELGLPDDGKPARAALPRDLSNGRSGTDAVATTTAQDPKRGDFATLFSTRKPPT